MRTALLFALALWASACAAADLSAAGARQATVAIPDELLVGFKSHIDATAAETVYRGHGAVKIEHLRKLNVHRIRVPAGGASNVIRALRQHPSVEFVEPNTALPPSIVPDDPYYPQAWHLPIINAPAAWDVTAGTPDVIVAILDTGADPTHPDFASKLLPGYNFVYDMTDTYDWHGHGTEVTGAAAAIGNNAIGVTGIAWHSKILPVAVADANAYATFSAIANGITWAADQHARVANLSYAASASATVIQAAQYAYNHGMLVVQAGGNCYCTDTEQIATPYILTVAATDEADNRAAFSSVGNYIDLSAPGVRIFSTSRGGGYSYPSGTSLSSPLVAGVAALMWAVNPTLTPQDVTMILQATADDKGTPGWDSLYGSGRVNAARAVQMAGGIIQPAAPSNLVATPTPY